MLERSVDKVQALKALGTLRQSGAYAGYKNISEFEEGRYETEWVSPISKAAHNAEASIFILMLDWTSEKHLLEATLAERRDMVSVGHTPGLETNVNLRRLLSVHLGKKFEDTFATNLFPFIKPKTMSEKLPPAILTKAAIEFAIPQIEIVRPRLVVCLGKDVFNTLRRLKGLRNVSNLDDATAFPFEGWETTIWGQAHTGYFGTLTREKAGPGTIDGDWAAMAEYYRKEGGFSSLLSGGLVQEIGSAQSSIG